MANVFTAKSTSKLSALSVVTTTPDTEVSYEIYLLTGYQLSYRAKGASKWTSTKLAADETSLTLKGLKKGKPVQVRIRGYVEVWDELHYRQWSKTRSSGK